MKAHRLQFRSVFLLSLCGGSLLTVGVHGQPLRAEEPAPPGATTTASPSLVTRLDSVQTVGAMSAAGNIVTEVEKMLQAGTDQVVVRAYIQNWSGRYSVSADQILHLHDIGASSDVLTALIQRSAQLQAQAAAFAQTPNVPPPSSPPPQMAPYPDVTTPAPATEVYPYVSPYPAYTYSYLYPSYSYPLWPSFSFYYGWPRYGYGYHYGYWGGRYGHGYYHHYPVYSGYRPGYYGHVGVGFGHAGSYGHGYNYNGGGGFRGGGGYRGGGGGFGGRGGGGFGGHGGGGHGGGHR
jgi:hypothetical protein